MFLYKRWVLHTQNLNHQVTGDWSACRWTQNLQTFLKHAFLQQYGGAEQESVASWAHLLASATIDYTSHHAVRLMDFVLVPFKSMLFSNLSVQTEPITGPGNY